MPWFWTLRTLYGTGPVKIIGNLPYYVSTPLIAKYTSALSPASILVLTLQREVAERLVAIPRTKQFGAMTVCCLASVEHTMRQETSTLGFLP